MQYLLKMIALAALLTGCTLSSTEPVQHQDAATTPNDTYQNCPKLRSDICTQEYLPVCGLTDEKLQRTYGNACTACAQEQVHGYLSGECSNSARDKKLTD